MKTVVELLKWTSLGSMAGFIVIMGIGLGTSNKKLRKKIEIPGICLGAGGLASIIMAFLLSHL